MRTVAVLLGILSIAHCVNLPTYFTKCAKHDPNLSECLLKNAKEGWPTFVQGDKAYHVQQMNPLHISSMHLNFNGNLRANFIDDTVNGLAEMDIKEIKFDFAKKRIDIKFFIPRLVFTGSYNVLGRILLLPIEGTGPANITFVNLLNHLYLEYDMAETSGEQFMQVKKYAMTYTVTRVHFRLENLFNGDERLGAAMNKVLNENWEVVNEEIAVDVGDGIGEIFSQILAAFFKKVSLNELFSK